MYIDILQQWQDYTIIFTSSRHRENVICSCSKLHNYYWLSDAENLEHYYPINIIRQTAEIVGNCVILYRFLFIIVQLFNTQQFAVEYCTEKHQKQADSWHEKLSYLVARCKDERL